MLLGKGRLLTALRKAARSSKAEQTLIAARRGERTTLRFSGGSIHQNFHEEGVTVWVKVACRGRQGVATASSLDEKSLSEAVDSAFTIAQLASSTGASSAPLHTDPPPQPTPKITTHFAATAHLPIAQLVGWIRALSACAQKGKVELAGSCVVGEEELAVAGSGGLTQYQPSTIAGMRLVATQGSASGFAAQTVRDIGALEPETLLKRAMDHCRLNRHPRPIRLGKYDVLLEPEAVAELVEWLAVIGFGAKQISERTSFMAGRIGERLMDRRLSILDDGSDEAGLAVPFDFEGIPKQRVRLIRNGLAEGVTYDSQYASLYRRPSTGHAQPYNEHEGPMPSNLFVEPGETPCADLLRSMRRGLWISRFHYVNGFLNTREALMTGLTRDGTFLVERGKVVGAVKSLRFTQSILEAFSNLVGLSRQRRLIADPSDGFFAVVTPAMLLQDFTFTGQTR